MYKKLRSLGARALKGQGTAERSRIFFNLPESNKGIVRHEFDVIGRQVKLRQQSQLSQCSNGYASQPVLGQAETL